jgi:hypothetical protein
MFSETNLKEVCQKLIHRSFSEFFLEKLYEEVFQKKRSYLENISSEKSP